MTVLRCSVTNLLTLAGLWTLFVVVRPNVTNLVTLASLWTLFGYDISRAVNKPANHAYIRKVSINLPGLDRFVTLDPATPKTVCRPAKVSRFIT